MKRKLILIIISVLILTLSIMGITYAFMRPQVEKKEEKSNVTIKACAKIQLKDNGSSINLENTYPMADEMGLETNPYEFTITSTCEDYIGFNLYLTSLTTNEIEDSNIHFAITSKENTVLISNILSKETDGLNDFNNDELKELDLGIKGTHKNIYKVYSNNLSLKGESNYKLYLWLDKDASNETMDKSFKVGLSIKSYNREESLAEYLIENKDETLIYHDGTIKSDDMVIDANDYSYRYAGASDIVNNYVCLENDNISTGECTDNNLYRIIGLFKNDLNLYEIKIIKNSPYEGEDAETGSDFTANGKAYYWSGSSENQKNTWKDSTLNTITLNKNFYDTLPTYVQSLISMHNYITGGNSSSNLHRKYIYETFQSEIVNPNVGNEATEEDKITKAKIGLMYLSDYGYAAYLEAWTTQTLNNYNVDPIPTNNWLFMNIYPTREYVITRIADDGINAYGVDFNGRMHYVNVASITFAIRPCFYLSTATLYVSGDGTSQSPYRLK